MAAENHSTKRLTVFRERRTFNPMVEYKSQQLDEIFLALADPTRRDMLAQLANGPCSVGELAEPYDMSLAAASKHIKMLERAGLIDRQVQGRIHVCRLDARPLHGGMEWIRHYQRFWNERLDQLQALLESDAKNDKTVPTAAPPRKKTRARKR